MRVLGEDDGRLANFSLCTQCAGLDAADDEGMGCHVREDDLSDPSVLQRIVDGLAKLRERLAKRRKRT